MLLLINIILIKYIIKISPKTKNSDVFKNIEYKSLYYQKKFLIKFYTYEFFFISAFK